MTRIEQLLDSPESFVGQRLNISGQVVVTAPATSHLAADYESFLEGAFVRLCDSGSIGEKLKATLPPFGGGECIYSESISVTGTVFATETGLELRELVNCKVVRGETEILV